MFISQARPVMDVEMQMLGGLIIATIGGKSATSVLLSDAATKFGREREHLVNDRQIVWLQGSERCDVALRDDEEMNRPIGLRVMKREDTFSLGDALDGHPS
jgi:hypothetical protein